MQRFLIHITKWLVGIVHALNWIFNFYAASIVVGCVSTYLYHTTNRQEWGVFVSLFTRGIIVYLLLILITNAILAYVPIGNLPSVMSYEKAAKAYDALGVEIVFLFVAWVVTTIVGRIMVNGYVQTFTGDPWWSTLYLASFRGLILFLPCKILQMDAIFFQIKKWTKE